MRVEEILKNKDNKEFQDKVDWYWTSKHKVLSEDIIREFQDKVDWYWISKCQVLSEDFIREFKDKVNWDWIPTCQVLSEDFIREFKDKVDWYWISTYQVLSEDIIREFQDKVDWYWIPRYQVLSEEFIREFELEISKDNMAYWNKQEKIKRIQKFGYEIKDDCVIAYKTARKDGTSVHNARFKYEAGKTYQDCRCDCNIDNYTSFGLSAWHKEYALEYHSSGKLFKVSIPIDKLGCITEKGKIRCWELTILEEVDEDDTQTT